MPFETTGFRSTPKSNKVLVISRTPLPAWRVGTLGQSSLSFRSSWLSGAALHPRQVLMSTLFPWFACWIGLPQVWSKPTSKTCRSMSCSGPWQTTWNHVGWFFAQRLPVAGGLCTLRSPSPLRSSPRAITTLVFSSVCCSKILVTIETFGLSTILRLVIPSILTDVNKTPCWSSSLRKTRRTEPVRQVPPKELKEIEDLTMDSLPLSSWAREATVTGAPKYFQVGWQGFEALLDGLLTGPDLGSTPAIVLVDLYSRVGDCFEAVIKKRQGFNTPLFYFGVAEEGKEKDRLQSTQLIEKVMDGSLKIPGAQPTSEVSNDVLPAVPPKRRLNVLVIGKQDKPDSCAHRQAVAVSCDFCKRFHSLAGWISWEGWYRPGNPQGGEAGTKGGWRRW